MNFQKIPVESVHPSPMNPRKTFDEEAINELAANIEKQGLIQPITVRPRVVKLAMNEYANDGYEIVCGERRYRAFAILKEREDAENVKLIAAHRRKLDIYQAIPAIVREMNDEDAFDAMITENLQRQDVDPLEEAFAFSLLIKNGKSVEDVALKFGKSTRFVQDRVKLNNLIPELMLAVKDGKMSISAAMIIAKLDEDSQRKFHSQYSGYGEYSKDVAQRFINGLFMTLSRAPWFDSDDQSDEDFEGGCGRKCSECQLNTANHGCLFWEMKANDAGRCTDREKYQSKLKAYLWKQLDAYTGQFVEKGQPLELGKIVIGVSNDGYGSDFANSIKQELKAEAEKRGLEVVNPISAFSSKCWDNDKDKIAEKSANGEIFRVLTVAGYDVPYLDETWWYLKKGDTATTSKGLPVEVSKLLNDYKIEEQTLPSGFVVNGSKALYESNEVDSDRELDDTEVSLLLCLLVLNNRDICVKLGIGNFPKDSEIREFIETNPDKKHFIIRSWMKKALGVGTATMTPNETMNVAKPYLDHLGELWCPEEYKAAKDKTQEKFDKKKSKIISQLRKLGYDLDGNKLS